MIGGQEKKSNHGHFGPVTGMDYNRFTVKDNVTVLTSGVDWTVRMWERERKVCSFFINLVKIHTKFHQFFQKIHHFFQN